MPATTLEFETTPLALPPLTFSSPFVPRALKGVRNIPRRRLTRSPHAHTHREKAGRGGLALETGGPGGHFGGMPAVIRSSDRDRRTIGDADWIVCCCVFVCFLRAVMAPIHLLCTCCRCCSTRARRRSTSPTCPGARSNGWCSSTARGRSAVSPCSG